jgi:enoyl-CoA hydratase/carnithine racemase
MNAPADAAFQTIAMEVDDGIATVTLSRPEALNTYPVRMKDKLVAAIDAIDADDRIGVVIVTGSGQAFCAGMDLSHGPAPLIRADEPQAEREQDSGGILALRTFASAEPVIAAVNGAAVGVGVVMESCSSTVPRDLPDIFTERGTRGG